MRKSSRLFLRADTHVDVVADVNPVAAGAALHVLGVCFCPGSSSDYEHMTSVFVVAVVAAQALILPNIACTSKHHSSRIATHPQSSVVFPDARRSRSVRSKSLLPLLSLSLVTARTPFCHRYRLERLASCCFCSPGVQRGRHGVGARFSPAPVAVLPDEGVEDGPRGSVPAHPVSVVGDFQDAALPRRPAQGHA